VHKGNSRQLQRLNGNIGSVLDGQNGRVNLERTQGEGWSAQVTWVGKGRKTGGGDRSKAPMSTRGVC